MAKKNKRPSAAKPPNNANRPAAAPGPGSTSSSTSSSTKKRNKYIAGALALGSALVAIKEFAYPVLIDYMDGKFGSSLELTIDNTAVNEGIPTYVFFPAGDAKKTDRFLIPAGLTLRNDAVVKADDVTLSARFDKDAHRPAMNEFITYSGTRPASDIKSETNGNNRYDFAVYRVKFLAPHGDMHFSEGGASHALPVSLAPFEPVLFSAFQGMDIQVKAFSDRDDEQTWDLRYRALAIRDMNQMSDVMKNYYAKQVALDVRQSLSTWTYLWRVFFGEKVNIVAYQPNFKYIQALSLYVPSEAPKDHLVYQFDPYKLSLLFDKPTN